MRTSLSTPRATAGQMPLPASLHAGPRVLRTAHAKADLSCTRLSLHIAKPRPSIAARTAMTDKPTTTVAIGSSLDDTANALPSKEALAMFHKAECVCFDVDCTITVNDSLDLLAEFMGVGEACAKLTSKAMDGSMNLEASLGERLNLINCRPSDIKRFIKAHPPASRLTPGIVDLIKGLKLRGVNVYLISGGFREMTLPIAKYLGIPPENVIANRMLWQWDDETGEPSKLVGFDTSEPTAHNRGKPEAIARLRQRFPYSGVVMIGDGITDLEAVQVSGGADLFIGYGGVVQRQSVKENCEWFITDWKELIKNLKQFKVAMVGSGAWACAALSMVSTNATTADVLGLYQDEIPMWVFEEDYEGRKLTEVINEMHENPKYLAGTFLGSNVVAKPNLKDVVEGADILIFCAPHQFLRKICKDIAGHVKPGAIGISLIKGMRVRSDGPQLISQMVSRYLNIDCSVLMGANVASGIAAKELSEAVIGYNYIDNGRLLKKLFERPWFRINLLPDVPGAEMCGTLKNIVAIAAGMVDGLGYGPNTKAAILRQGLDEMRRFSKALFPAVRDETFLESCGMADLIATCYGGRNRLVAMEYTKAIAAGEPKSFEQLEQELLNGQKLQGVLTSNEVQEIITNKQWEAQFPLFTTTNRIITGKLEPKDIVRYNELLNSKAEQKAAVKAPGAGPKFGSLTISLDEDTP